MRTAAAMTARSGILADQDWMCDSRSYWDPMVRMPARSVVPPVVIIRMPMAMKSAPAMMLVVVV